jgi:hypothetical protein
MPIKVKRDQDITTTQEENTGNIDKIAPPICIDLYFTFTKS